MNCKKCGFEVDRKDSFCPKCGEKVQWRAKSARLPIAFCIVTIIVAIVVVIVILKFYQDKDDGIVVVESGDKIEESIGEEDNVQDISDSIYSVGEIEEKKIDLVEPYSFFGLSREFGYDEIIKKYSIGLFNEENSGENYSGNIGDLVETYNNIDIDGDGLFDEIDREDGEDDSRIYSILLSDGKKIDGPEFSRTDENFTDYGDVIELLDINQDGTDEILFTQYEKFAKYHEVTVRASILMVCNDEGEWSLVDMLFPDKYSAQLNSIYGIELIEDGVVLLADYGTNNNGNCYDVFKFGMNNGKFNFVENSPEYVKEYWPVKYNSSNTMASGLDDNSKKAFGKVLEDLYFKRALPDESTIEDHISGNYYSVYFGMTDYNGDGKKELKIKIDEEFRINAIIKIYAYSDEMGLYEMEEGFFTYNIIASSRSKNVGNFEIAKYTPDENRIDQAYVQAWTKDDWNTADKWYYDFPDDRDADGDGTIYSLMERALWVYASSDNDEYWNDKYVYDKSELMEKIDALTNGAKILDEIVCTLPKGNRLLYEQTGRFLDLQ